VVRELWASVDAGGSFDLRDTPYFAGIGRFGFVAGRSTHADRVATIQAVWEKYGVMIDTHTADAVRVAIGLREPGVPLLVLETAQPVKFEETIREALGREPERPAEMVGIENLPQRVEVMDPEVEQVKGYIVRHCPA
jgi:threonine synthase